MDLKEEKKMGKSEKMMDLKDEKKNRKSEKWKGDGFERRKENGYINNKMNRGQCDGLR